MKNTWLNLLQSMTGNKSKMSEQEHLNWLVNSAMETIMDDIPNGMSNLMRYGITPGEARQDLGKYREFLKPGLKGGYYFSRSEINRLHQYLEIEDEDPEYYYVKEKNLPSDEEHFDQLYY